MAEVYKIVINSVSVAKTEVKGIYDITLTWELDEGAQEYNKDFWLIPYYGTGHDNLLPVSCGGKIVREATVSGVPLDGGKEYSLALTANQTKFTSCEKVPITVHTYEGVGIHYEHDTLIIGWEPPHETIREGVITISFPDDDYYEYGVPQNVHLYTFSIPDEWRESYCYRLPLPSSWFTKGKCTVIMTPYAVEESSGPESAPAVLTLKPLKIAAVNVGEITAHARKVEVTLGSSDAEYVQMGFYEAGNLVCLSSPLPFASSVTYSLQGQHAYNANKFELAVYISDSEAKSYNRHRSADNSIPLALPELTADLSENPPVLSWTHGAPGCTAYTLQVGEASPKKVYGNSYTMTEELSKIMDSEIQLTPEYGVNKGSAAKIRVFREGFYYHESRLSFRDTSFGTQGFSISLTPAAFSEIPSDTVEAGAFKLEKCGSGYKVTVSGSQPAHSDFINWLKRLFANKLTPLGYYKIRDIMSRLLSITEEERLWYAAGLDPACPKRADILPGMTLRVETAQYMSQVSSTAADLAGYAPGSAVDYAVGLCDGVLNVNPYLSKAMGYFAYSGEPYSDPLFHAAAGGIDFFNIGFKQPFWVLRHPDKVSRSESKSNLYPTSNTVLFAVPEWEDTLVPDSDTKDHMVFRARSTVSLMYTVFVNNTPRLVHVGETCDGLMEKLGCSGQTPRILRNTGLGGLAQVLWTDGTGIILLPGDRIEV